MFLTVREMAVLCTLHAGTLSETIALLRSVKDGRAELMATIKSLAEKLEGMKDGESVSLYFEPEQ